MATLRDPDSVWNDVARCDGCDSDVPLMLLDSKPGHGKDVLLFCRSCYGPGWLPTAEDGPP